MKRIIPEIYMVNNLKVAFHGALGLCDNEKNIILIESNIDIIRKTYVASHELEHRLMSVIMSNDYPSKFDGLLDLLTCWLNFPTNTAKALKRLGLIDYCRVRFNYYKGK